MFSLPKIPGYPPADFGIGITPLHSSLIAGIHTGATFDAIFNLKMNLACLVKGITVCRTYIGGALMWTAGITNRGIDQNMRFNLASGLVSIIHPAQFLGEGTS